MPQNELNGELLNNRDVEEVLYIACDSMPDRYDDLMGIARVASMPPHVKVHYITEQWRKHEFKQMRRVELEMQFMPYKNGLLSLGRGLGRVAMECGTLLSHLALRKG